MPVCIPAAVFQFSNLLYKWHRRFDFMKGICRNSKWKPNEDAILVMLQVAKQGNISLSNGEVFYVFITDKCINIY